MTTDVRTPVIRELGEADAQAILEIAVAGDVAETGSSDLDLAGILRELRNPYVRSFGSDDGAGLAGYAWVANFPVHVTLMGDVRLRPDANPDLAQPLLEHIRRVGTEMDPARPLHLTAHSRDDARRRWLAAAGGEPVRHFWRMLVDLDGAGAAPPVLPTGVAVRNVADDDDDKRRVAEVVHASFRDHIGHDPAAELDYEEFRRRTHTASGFDLGLWWLATVDEAPAAALISRQTSQGGYVDTLGTLRAFRGRGLGRALLRTAFAEFGRRGFAQVRLHVDASNPTGAVGLYESVGMRAEHEWVAYELPPRERQLIVSRRSPARC